MMFKQEVNSDSYTNSRSTSRTTILSFVLSLVTSAPIFNSNLVRSLSSSLSLLFPSDSSSFLYSARISATANEKRATRLIDTPSIRSDHIGVPFQFVYISPMNIVCRSILIVYTTIIEHIHTSIRLFTWVYFIFYALFFAINEALLFLYLFFLILPAPLCIPYEHIVIEIVIDCMLVELILCRSCNASKHYS